MGNCMSSSLFQITLQERGDTAIGDKNGERKARRKARSILIITQIHDRHLSSHTRATEEIAINPGWTSTVTRRWASMTCHGPTLKFIN